MLNALMQLARPALLALDPETAHETTLRALEKGLYPADRSADPPTLAARLGGLALTNPIAVAAGFDKDARVPDAVLGLGCGFAEIGTVTPLAQAGNPQPARLPPHQRARRHQSARLQQRWPCGGAGSPQGAPGAAASSASTSAPTKTRPIAPATTCRASTHSTTSRATSPSTSPRRTRRACATSRRRLRSTNCSAALWQRASSRWPPASRAGRSSSRSRPISRRLTCPPSPSA